MITFHMLKTLISPPLVATWWLIGKSSALYSDCIVGLELKS